MLAQLDYVHDKVTKVTDDSMKHKLVWKSEKTGRRKLRCDSL